MNKVLYLALMIMLPVGCTNKEKIVQEETTLQRPIKMGVAKEHQKEIAEESSDFVPSGTQLEFRKTKKFTVKDSSINFEMSAEKKCTLVASLDHTSEVEITEGSLLTVVGYREESNELVLTDSNYHQYQISCNTKEVKPRQPAGVPLENKTIHTEDLQNLQPLLVVRFLPM